MVSRDAEDQAIQHAKDITQVEAIGIVQPALSDSLLHRDAAAIGALDVIVRQRILSADVVRVKLWTADGTILYSDESRLIGRRFPLDPGEQAIFHGGPVQAGVSDLTDAENVYERSFGKLLQVYLPVHTPGGTPLLFETYQRYEAISQYQQSVWSSFLPVLLVGLAILFVVQIPLALGMARRLRASLAERQVLLERVITASEQERRRIARDLHDGVVQRLAAVTFSLSALARRLTSHGATGAPAATVPDVEHAAGETRAAMRDLRTLIVEIAPPNLHAEGIDNALRDLLEPLAGNGVTHDARCATRHRAVGGDDDAALPRRPGGVAQHRQARRRLARRGAPAQPRRPRAPGDRRRRPRLQRCRPRELAVATATWVSASCATSWPTPAARCGSRPSRARGRRWRSRFRADERTAHPPPHRRRPPACAPRPRAAVRRGAGHRGHRQLPATVSRRSASRSPSSPTSCSWTSPCPGMDGIEATRRLLAIRPEARVVMLTSFADHERVMEALDSGAVGYILKDAESDELLRAVRAAAGGDSPLSPRAARALITARRGRRPFEELTSRELDVLKLVARGLSNKQIAWRLAISEKTVKAHMTSIFGRIGVADRTQAALWAQRHGVV